MINAIVQFAVKQRVAVVIFALFLLGGGVWRATQLNVDNEPDVTNTQVVVSALAPAYGPEELETRVTFPLEIALAGMKDLDHTESISQFGLSQVTCYFDEKIDIYQARELVNERLMQAQGQLPAGVNAQMNPVSTGLGEILHVRLVGGPMTPLEQRTFMDWTVRPQLLTVPGIADVNVIGGRTRQWQVAVDAQKLAAYGLTIPDVDAALSHNNANIGGSFLTQGPTQRIVRGVGLVQSLGRRPPDRRQLARRHTRAAGPDRRRPGGRRPHSGDGHPGRPGRDRGHPAPAADRGRHAHDHDGT